MAIDIASYGCPVEEPIRGSAALVEHRGGSFRQLIDAQGETVTSPDLPRAE
jgi:hypothetical protein